MMIYMTVIFPLLLEVSSKFLFDFGLLLCFCYSLNFLICIVDPPSVTIHKQEVTVVEGHNTSLACNVSGKPYPAITWTKRGSSLVLSNTSSLDLYNVSRHDATDDIIQYNCTASNGVGTPATAMVNITVHCKCLGYLFYILPLR